MRENRIQIMSNLKTTQTKFYFQPEILKKLRVRKKGTKKLSDKQTNRRNCLIIKTIVKVTYNLKLLMNQERKKFEEVLNR